MIDKLDQEIIFELQKNARESYSKLARVLNVSEGTIRYRIRNIVGKDITKVVVLPNVWKLGYGFIGITAIQIRMEDLRKITENLSSNAHVCYLAWVTGRYDLMAIFICRSPQEFASIVEKEIATIPGILKLETFVQLDILKGGWGFIDTSGLFSSLEISPSSKPKRRTH